ncbi:MAG: glycosyltransferase [Lachnospiraceae bacterium]|nr:glycosyltransferase [Lachnospiraceae bacterium]
MKILTLKWDCFGYFHIRKAFKLAGFDLCELDFPIKKESTKNSENLANLVVKAILDNKADAVFSFNYFPVAAIAAAACRVKYISWTYDSPYILLYSKTIEFPTNYAFVFDKNEYINLRRKGAETVYYLPMAADTEYFDSVVISDTERNKYSADIALIGSMYTEAKHNLIRHFNGLDDYTSGYLDGIISIQKQIYGASILEKSLTPEIVKNIQKVCPMYESGDGIEDASWVLANYFVARKITGMERQELVAALSQKYNVTLYTPEKTPTLPLVDNRGSVEYYKDSPKAIKCAKINLNITLRSIVNAIPLRAFDIMGCGGFLLTNYQADFEDYFIPGTDFVYFESKSDLIEKAGYYLEHDDERLAIAYSGYKKIQEYHSFNIRVAEMINIAELR